MPVRDIDTGARRFVAALEDLALHGARVTVGTHAEEAKQVHEGSDSNQKVGAVALANEMTIRRVRGSKKKQGGYLRRSVALLRRQLADELRRAAADVLEGASVEYAFATPGRTLLHKMRELVPVDTGQVRDSFRVHVRDREVA